MTPDEWATACAQSAAPFAPQDVTGTPEQIEARCDDEGDAARDHADPDQRDHAELQHCARWDAYLMAWHAAADQFDAERRRRREDPSGQ